MYRFELFNVSQYVFIWDLKLLCFFMMCFWQQRVPLNAYIFYEKQQCFGFVSGEYSSLKIV